MPDLPAAYPRHGISLELEATAPPLVTFGGGVAPSANTRGAASRGAKTALASGARLGTLRGGPDDVSVDVSYITVVSVLNATEDGSPLQVGRAATRRGPEHGRGPPTMQQGWPPPQHDP
jgi:hypothetical protein